MDNAFEKEYQMKYFELLPTFYHIQLLLTARKNSCKSLILFLKEGMLLSLIKNLLDSRIGLQREDLFLKILNKSDNFLKNLLELILEIVSEKHLTACIC